MDSDALDDDDKAVIKHNTPEAIQQRSSSSHDNNEEEEDTDKLDSSKNTSVNAETENTEVSKLETNSRIINDVPQIDNNEPILHADENLSNDNHPISKDLHNERSPIRTNNELGEENFPMSVEQHCIPQFRMNQETHSVNDDQIIIYPDANNAHGINNYLNEIELNSFVNTHTLYTIYEENHNEQSAEEQFHQHRSSRNRIRTFPRRNRATETRYIINLPMNSFNDENLNTVLFQNENRSNPSLSSLTSLLHNYSSNQELLINSRARLTDYYNNFSSLINEQQRDLVELRNALQPSTVDNEISGSSNLPSFIYLSQRRARNTAMLNRLINENRSMEQLDLQNPRLNHSNNIVDINHNSNNEVPPNNLPTVEENLPQLRHREYQPLQLPFQQQILIANGGIYPMNGGYNTLIRLIRNNPNLMFFNIRNLILIFHPRILEEDNNILFNPNMRLSPAWELLRQNNEALNNRFRNQNNQELNREAGPSNERNRNSEERNP